MQYLSSFYFVNPAVHVSGIFVAHHQEVYCMYTIGTCFAFLVECCPGWAGTVTEGKLVHQLGFHYPDVSRSTVSKV